MECRKSVVLVRDQLGGWTGCPRSSGKLESRDCLREAVAELAMEAGMTSSVAQASHSPSDGQQQAERVGMRERCDTWCLSLAITVKTPKYSGQSDLEAFEAQFELLARAEKTKALQLALCLTRDAFSCLLLLPQDERNGALVEAL